ncbi:MAG: carboxypeptidase-like regulatory domain-containing protein, partial [Deltaproteobacteria bacterium]
MKKSILIMSALLMSGSMANADERAANEKGEKAQTPEERREAFREQFAQLLPVTIYGKVVDQNDNPVSGANVRISWERATYLIGKADHGRDDWVNSDADGCFTFICDHPHRAFADASKDGYESPPSSSGNLIWNRTAKANPVVLRLRKKGPTTFLVVSPSDNQPPADLFRTKGTNCLSQTLDLFAWDADARWRHSVTADADLRIDAAFDAEKNNWIVTYAATNGAGGLILSDSMLYEAPESGYVPQATVIVTNQEQGCYLYLKSRTPTIYSRILFNHRYNNRGDLTLRLYCKAWVNP